MKRYKYLNFTNFVIIFLGLGNVSYADKLPGVNTTLGVGLLNTTGQLRVNPILVLGTSGTVGTLTLGNATSGTLTLQPVAGALGTITASFPANTGVVAETNLAQTFTARQTMSAAGPLELGANSGNVGSIKIYGNTSGDALITVPAAAGTATRFQLPATNGTNNYVLKTDGSGNTSWVAPSGGSALTVTDGTNNVTDTTTITFGSGFLVGGSAGSSTVNSTGTINTQSGATYTILSTDAGKTVLRTYGTAMTDAVPQATGATFGTGFGFGIQTGAGGDTLTSTTSTINGISGATGIKMGPQQASDWLSDGTNWRVALGMPQCATQTGTTFIRDDYTCATLPAATTSVAGIAKLHNVPVSIGWPAGLDPNNTVIAVINQASTVSAIIGALETANGSTATVSVKKAPSGTACSAGTTLHSGSFNANSTAATNQTLTVTTASVAAGDRLCLQTTGTWTGGGGSGIGTITVFLAPS